MVTSRSGSSRVPSDRNKRARTGRLSESPPQLSTLVQALAAVDMADRHAESGDRNRALGYYGEALDAYLREGLYGMAASVAQRMIRRYPDVIRARMTLAVLNLVEGLRKISPDDVRSTCPGFEEYLLLVGECGQGSTAVRHLRRLAEATQSVPVRRRIAEFLLALGDEEGAQAAERVILREDDDPAVDATDQTAVWVSILLDSSPSRRRRGGASRQSR